MAKPRPRIGVNIITGFLGVGKTSAILKLLQQRSNERWAVLVNEFGEIGIDGALFASSGIAIREVPGGCMCCVAGVPTQVALNKLIRDARPDRILIEPTGLGHPANILKMLTGGHFADILAVRATITLIDPRVLDDLRYTGNDNFIGQVQAADILVAAKTDLCTPAQLQGFADWACAVRPDAQVGYLHEGRLQRQWLDRPRRVAIEPSSHDSSLLLLTPRFSNTPLPTDQPVLRRANSGGGFFSCGWIFDQTHRFVFDKLFTLLNNLDVLRCKAVMNTDRGAFAFNLLDGALSVSEMPNRSDSRIEFIAPEAINWDLLEQWLRQALR